MALQKLTNNLAVPVTTARDDIQNYFSEKIRLLRFV